MRFNRILVVGLIASTSAMWMACGGDDAAVNGDDTSGNDAGASDATTGADGNTGTDSGNPADSGTPDANDGGCAVAFPSLPAGEIVCPGAPGGACIDAGACCGSTCNAGDLCGIGKVQVTCERASDCKNDHSCCIKLTSAIDLDASTCPLTGTATDLGCAPIGSCPAGFDVACASDAECDGGKCRALSISIGDGGTIVGVCAP